MARLSVRQDRPDIAWRVLAPVYERFTEGFNTPDLRSAFASAAYWAGLKRQLRAPAARGQPIQLHKASPMTRSRSRPFSHGSSSVNKVTHCRQEQGIRGMSV